jgi:BirA family biotin operon repressor/biotin-[acetyl-CoA-carboxylase] ligase
LVAVADHQTAGRGRLGRTWEAPPGSSLLLSVLLRPVGLPLDRRHLLTAAVALAGVAGCAAASGGSVVPGLKWPNDLVMPDDTKVAGVLAESDRDAVVVGIGINVRSAPPGASCVGDAVSVEVVRDGLLARLSELYGDWATVAREYRRACVTVGRQVRVELPDETFTGVAADVTDDGHLLVDVGMCLRTVVAADVIHLRPA